jgi:hypothetical protein
MKMKNWRKSLFFAVCSAMVSSIRGPRASADENINPGQHAFIRQYVSAITSRNRARLKKLLHPTVLACMTEESRDYFDFMIDKEIGHSEALRGGYTIMRIEDFGSAFSFLPPELDFGQFRRRRRVHSPCVARCGREFLCGLGAAGT